MMNFGKWVVSISRNFPDSKDPKVDLIFFFFQFMILLDIDLVLTSVWYFHVRLMSNRGQLKGLYYLSCYDSMEPFYKFVIFLPNSYKDITLFIHESGV